MGRPKIVGPTPGRIKVEAVVREIAADWTTALAIEMRVKPVSKTTVNRCLLDMLDERIVERRLETYSNTWNGWGIRPRGNMTRYAYRLRPAADQRPPLVQEVDHAAEH